MNNDLAVVIAGDFRTMRHAILTYGQLLRDTDVYVSIWSTSQSVHKVNPRKPIDHGSVNMLNVIDMLHSVHVDNIEGIKVSDYDTPKLWVDLGYNSNYLHRINVGIDMVKQSGKAYRGVLFTRPDVYFHNNEHILKERLRDAVKGTFYSTYSTPEKVHQRKSLNDIIFGCHFDDLDRVLPTTEQYQAHKHRDWHTFLRDWVVNIQGMDVVNTPELEAVILRPPSRINMTYEEAITNVHRWDDVYVIHCINRFGVREAIKQWDKHTVLRAIQNLPE